MRVGDVPAADLRTLRYLRWLEVGLPGYPEAFVDVADHQLAVRMLSVMDCACLLLSDESLDRLLRLLEYLDANETIVPRHAAARLMELGERDFFWFITRRIASATADEAASLEEMAATWREEFSFRHISGGPTGTLFPDGAFLPYQKPYRGMLIDRALDDVQMNRLNAVEGIKVTSTCAGHPELSTAPHLCYTTAQGERVDVESPIPNTGANDTELRTWWDEAIDNAERSRITRPR